MSEALRHVAAIADTGDGYVFPKGRLIRCCWCDWYAVAPTKADAVALYRRHERYQFEIAESQPLVGDEGEPR